MKHLKLFENFEGLTRNDLDKELLPYYDAIALLPEFYKGLIVIKQESVLSKYSKIAFEFIRIKPVTEEENDRHVGEFWEFEIESMNFGEINIICGNTGDHTDVETLADMFNYTTDKDEQREIWRTLIQKDPSYKIECPADFLEEFNHKTLANVKRYGVFESSHDDMPESLKLYYNIVLWSNSFTDLIVTTKFDHKVFCFENDRGGKNECGFNIKNILYCQFGIFSDLIALDSLEQFVDFCAQDLATVYVFGDEGNFNFNNEHSMRKFERHRKEFAVEIWKRAIEHDITYKMQCPIEILNQLGHVKIGNMKKIGVFD